MNSNSLSRPRRTAAAALVLALLAACAQGARAQGPGARAAELERAQTLLTDREFERAAAVLRDLLRVDPANRRAREMLAFALEASGDLGGERRVRSALATEFPGDARAQLDYGRVLERSGEESGALAVYRRAQALGAVDPGLDAAIDRMRGRTAIEVGVPFSVLTDPDASATRVQTGAALPLGSRHHVTLLAAHHAADRTSGPGTTAADLFALSLAGRHPSGASWMVGPRLHVIAPEGGASDRAVGGAVAGRAPVARWLEVEASGDLDVPWEDAALAVLHGGRMTGAQARLYAPLLARRLLFQVGAQRRTLSILGAGPGATERPQASQQLWAAGADFVVWRKPGAAVRGEMLDESLTVPVTVPAAVSLGYRHYEVISRPTPEFATLIALAPRGSVDEASASVAVTSPRGHLGLELRGGVGRDSARDAQTWRASGAVIWAPTAVVRLAVGYEEATEAATGLVGRRQSGWLSFHVDF